MNALRQRPAGPPDPPSRPRAGVLWATVLAAFLLVACGGGEAPSGPATPLPASPSSGEPAPIAPPERPIFSGPVTWAADVDPATGGPANPVASLPADAPRLVAAVRIREGRAPGRIAASWAYNATAMPAFDATLDVPAGDGLAWAAFTLEMPGGEAWPAGTYEITLSLDGEQPVTGRIEVPPQP